MATPFEIIIFQNANKVNITNGNGVVILAVHTMIQDFHVRGSTAAQRVGAGLVVAALSLAHFNEDFLNVLLAGNGAGLEAGQLILEKLAFQNGLANLVDKGLAEFILEQSVSLEGVADAAISFVTQKLKVCFAEGVEPATVMPEVLKACRKVERDVEIKF